MRLEPGQRVGKYEVVDLLAEGGMSESFRARDCDSGDLVVLKVPFASMLGDMATYSRYQRELAIGAKLNHPGIQRFLGSGQINGAAPYSALEYVEGESFRRFVDREAPLPEERAVELAQQIGSALAACHAAGIIHRDLKPENLLITANGKTKLLDFGIALLQGARRVTWGPLSEAVGTPDYMAPEQIRGERGDARTDVYALGAMLFEMLTGARAYSGDNAIDIMRLHVEAEARRARTLREDVSPALDGIVAKAIRRDPKERYQSMTELLEDLSRYHDLDPAAFAWAPSDDWLTLPPPVGPMPSLRRTLVIVLLTFAVLAALGVLAQLAHHG